MCDPRPFCTRHATYLHVSRQLLTYITFFLYIYIHMCHVTPPYVPHDSFIRVTSPIHTCHNFFLYASHDSSICVKSPFQMHHTHTCVYVCVCVRVRVRVCSLTRHDSFICETWLIHTWDPTNSYVRHDSFICETRLIHMLDMNNSHVCNCFP